MNSRVLIILAALLCSGCDFSNGSENDVHPDRSYRLVMIEGHEYIFISRRPYGAQMAIAHNANCKSTH